MGEAERKERHNLVSVVIAVSLASSLVSQMVEASNIYVKGAGQPKGGMSAGGVSCLRESRSWS
jgi:hypothetical protein